MEGIKSPPTTSSVYTAGQRALGTNHQQPSLSNATCADVCGMLRVHASVLTTAAPQDRSLVVDNRASYEQYQKHPAAKTATAQQRWTRALACCRTRLQVCTGTPVAAGYMLPPPAAGAGMLLRRGSAQQQRWLAAPALLNLKL